MSGRIYDVGRPFCSNCNKRMISSRENNWNGDYCTNCNSKNGVIYLKPINVFKRMVFIGKILGKKEFDSTLGTSFWHLDRP